MSSAQSLAAAQQKLLPVVRELVRAYQAFVRYSDRQVRTLGLTPPQFDVIATLGNTGGMSMCRLGEKTLITKGTLTGIVDRLESKGLVHRRVAEGNRRSFVVALTPEEEALFEQVFPAHIAHLQVRFERLSEAERLALLAAFEQFRALFADP